MVVPIARAFGGRKVRNNRAGLAQAEKGLNFTDTSVINLEIMVKTETEDVVESNSIK